MYQMRPGGFSNMPPVIKNLLVINVGVFLLQMAFDSKGSPALENLFALHTVQSVYFKPHQLVTHLFMHGGFGHLLFNMLALWMFGATLENRWGSKRFLIFYMASGLGAALLHLGVLYMEMEPVMEAFRGLSLTEQQELLYDPRFRVNVATIGASGAVFGCLAAFAYLFPNTEIYIYFLFPVKAKWFVLFYAAMELYLGVQNSAGDSVAHWAHLGGALVGFLLVLYWNRTDRRNFY
ncbi:MAG: rhomboid family intramembrane serine protease [Candidatus Pseudobacter hemicellulosilyticus]|uniref:Rhomboid family intramembrane serine protease n=1 Tax=Candidatus Pseudobacter hemicellulosilyticus TaxID=3121375 RepID=A0AAJ5WRZ9_9BACT|nr:MAG: rhomboid family intramembrane serine protease [Pseudobacter sp.]